MKYNTTLTEWLAALNEAVTAGTFATLTLNKPTAAAGDLKSIDIRPIMVKRELKLSFTHHHKTRDIVKNHTLEESIALVARLMNGTFAAGRLCTLSEDLLLAQNAKGYTLTHQPPTRTQAPDLAHDKPKQRLVQSEGKSYLHALGLTDAQGNVLKTAQDKFRQINKYIEVLDGLVKKLPPQKVLRVVDMGSGKGYLTFALYDHLANTLKMDVEVTGVEYRPDLVKLCNDIAWTADFNGLKFVQGAIADHDCTGAHVVIALHACDTATDDAIYKAIKADAALIVVAPCCHKQIRRQIATAADHPLGFLLRYGTYAERMAEAVTDGLRAQLLELSGYTPNVFEFISDAHTPKNVMIVATRAPKAPNTAKIKASIASAKAQFGIESHYLEKLLGR